MAKVARSRGGCERCKSLHTKCDEKRPACGRCVRASIQCSGYTRAIRWSRKHEVRSSAGNVRTTPEAATSPTEANQPQESADVNLRVSEVPNQAAFLELDLVDEWSSNISFLDSLFGLDGQLSSASASGMGDLPPNTSRDTTASVTDELEENQEPFAPSWESYDPNIDWRLMNGISATQAVLPDTQWQAPDMESPRQQSQSASAYTGGRSSIVHQQIRDTDTLLTQFYFHETARIYSVYDGVMNPFRGWVGRMWSNSRLIFCAMQSMAAANLERFYPTVTAIGRRLRDEAHILLANNTDCERETLLALLMVGATSSWFDAKDSGASLFVSFQSRLKRATLMGKIKSKDREGLFFQGSLVYWRMLLSYVHDDPRILRDDIGTVLQSSLEPSTLPLRHTPHPWAGVGFEIQRILCEVGLLVRADRRRTKTSESELPHNIFDSQNLLLEAFELESRLLQAHCPSEHQVMNPGDQNTPVNHLLLFAEVYRQLGLLQIYRIFPEVLKSRLEEDKSTWAPCTRWIFMSAYQQANSWGPLTGLLQKEWSPIMHASWLTAFALSILDRLKILPIEAGTGAFQPFVLVALSGELWRPALLIENALELELPDGDLILMDAGILRARQMIVGRLRMLRDFLPPKPWELCVSIVEEVWMKLDSSSGFLIAENQTKPDKGMPFWLDVMIEHGYETLMG